jgi:hypothetical protein
LSRVGGEGRLLHPFCHGDALNAGSDGIHIHHRQRIALCPSSGLGGLGDFSDCLGWHDVFVLFVSIVSVLVVVVVVVVVAVVVVVVVGIGGSVVLFAVVGGGGSGLCCCLKKVRR